jgi:VWFA-related protein
MVASNQGLQMLPRFASFGLSLLLSFLPLALAAQQRSPAKSASPARSETVLRSTSRLVQLSVIVKNKNGEPILGLKKHDFTLLDGGRKQKIAFFSTEGPAPITPHRALPSNVFTNRFDLNGQDPGTVTILLYDALNTSFFDQAYARAHILRFLKTVRAQDHVALYALTTQLRILQDFTGDTSSLVSAANRIQPKETVAFDASHPENFDVPALHNDPMWMRFQDAVNNANGEIADQYTINRVGLTTAAIIAIADHVAGIPGRKSLIWISDGIPIQIGMDRIGAVDRDTVSFGGTNAGAASSSTPPRNDLSAAARALNRSNLTIYPVDAHGVEVDPVGGGGAAFFMRQDRRDTFRLLADRTGGKAFYGTNDIAGAIHDALEDGRYTYTLGYYPDHGIWDGKFRGITLNVKAADARLRYRRGYYALPNRSEGEPVVKAELREAAFSPLEATNLGMIVTGEAAAPLSPRTVLLQITLDPKQFLLQDLDNRREGGLDLLFLQMGATGNFLAAERQHFGVNFAPKEYAYLAKVGLVLQRHLAIQPGAVEVRIAVRDANSGSLGSVTFPVKAFFPPVIIPVRPPKPPS